MNAELRTHVRVVCPHCGVGDSRVDHLFEDKPRDAGPWYCDECGKSYVVRAYPDRRVEVEKRDEIKIKTFDLLMLPPQDKPVYFVLSGMRFEGNRWPSDDEVESKRFYYESHSCPTNWLKPDMVMGFMDGDWDTDPHGLLRFVAFRDESTFPPDEHWGPNARDDAQEQFVRDNMNTPIPVEPV